MLPDPHRDVWAYRASTGALIRIRLIRLNACEPHRCQEQFAKGTDLRCAAEEFGPFAHWGYAKIRHARGGPACCTLHPYGSTRCEKINGGQGVFGARTKGAARSGCTGRRSASILGAQRAVNQRLIKSE